MDREHNKHIRLVLAYKDFSKECHISHIGLGVTAINIAKVLRANEIEVHIWPIAGSDVLEQRLHHSKAQGLPISHVVIAAPWIPSRYIAGLCMRWPNVKFAVNTHSNVGFLQAEPQAIKLIRQYLDLEMGTHNFTNAGNNSRFVKFIRDAYGVPCTYLPNLYYLHDQTGKIRPHFHGGKLRIGCFGATRPYKNFTCAVAAAVEMGHQLKTETEIWINAGRSDGNGNVVRRSAEEIVRDLPTIHLRELSWCDWPNFRSIVRSMHILLQPSYTETFNNVTADGVAEGVPSVVSNAIDWAPKSWQAQCDDIFDIARVGRNLLNDHEAVNEGMHALRSHNSKSVRSWLSFLHNTQPDGQINAHNDTKLHIYGS